MDRFSIFARRLKQARLRAGISQKDLGIKAGISYFTASSRINQYERSVHVPDLQIVTNIAAALKMPVPYFYCRDKDLAAIIVKAAALEKAHRKRLLNLINEL